MASPASSGLSITGSRSFRNLVGQGAIASPRGVAKSNASSPVSGHTRRTSSGRYLSLSRDENENAGEVTSDYPYVVQIPPTPDNQPMSGNPAAPIDPNIAVKAEQQFVSSTIFTGGFNSVTRGHVMEKMIEGEANHPQMACARGSSCSVQGCDAPAMRDERGDDVLPCECNFRICRDCYVDALNATGNCPGCKEQYKILEGNESRIGGVGSRSSHAHAAPLPLEDAKLDRRLSLMKSNKPPLLMSNQSSEFDHARWLYETKGTYGYGNAVWPKDDDYGAGMTGPPPNFNDKSRRPLSRRTSISAGIISPYRY